MREYVQHGVTSCLEHCISVSYRSYLACKEYGLDARAAARAGLLHDLFLYDWHSHRPEPGEGLHGFTHPRRALEKAERDFELNDAERAIILHDMWPLTITPPTQRASYKVLWPDKV